MNGTFYEQLGGVTGVFEQWGACERTVVMCALARRIPWTGLKMLQRSVEDAIAREAPPAVDCERLQREANDGTLVANLLAATDTDESDDGISSLEQLVALVPLSGTAIACLLASQSPQLVHKYGRSPTLRRLLTYLLVHPALNDYPHHQRTLTQYLRYMENHTSDNAITDNLWSQRIEPPMIHTNNIWGYNGTFRRTIGKNLEFRMTLDSLTDQYNSDLQESFSKNGRDVDLSGDEDKLNFDATIAQPKNQRSNSLTPPTSNFMSSSENLCEEPLLQKPRSFSLSSEHSLSQLRPIGVFGTTGSETRLDALRSQSGSEPGMSMVAPWLKSLRLHKYIWLFSNITYDQMMAMDEEYLEKLGVTTGARHKLLLSIRRVCSRVIEVLSVAKDIHTKPVDTHHLLVLLRSVLMAPLPRDTHVCHAIVALLETASQCLMSGANEGLIEDEHESVDPISLHCWLVEKALHHELFQEAHLNDALKRMRYRLPPRQFYHRLSDLPHRRPLKPRKSLGFRPRPRPKCARPPAADIHCSLDALCLQMTEHAID